MEKSALFRLSGSSLNLRSDFTTAQREVDTLTGVAFDQAGDWKTFLPIVAGGFANRWVKLGLASTASELAPSLSKIPYLVRGSSAVIALGAESAAFEIAHRGLISLSQPPTSFKPSLFQWSGREGLKEGWLHSFVNFGALKSVGRFAEGQNLILQHGAQAFGMVAGHQLLFLAGWGERPEGSLADQLFQAEAINLQVGAGLGLLHFMAPGIQTLERVADLSLRAREGGTNFRFPRFLGGDPSPFPTTAGSSPARPFSRSKNRAKTGEGREREAKDFLNLMSTLDGEGNGGSGGKKGASYSDEPAPPPATPEEGQRRGEESLEEFARENGGESDYVREQMAIILQDAYQEGQRIELDVGRRGISSKDWNHIEAYRIVAEELGYEIGAPEEFEFDPATSKARAPLRKIEDRPTLEFIRPPTASSPGDPWKAPVPPPPPGSFNVTMYTPESLALKIAPNVPFNMITSKTGMEGREIVIDVGEMPFVETLQIVGDPTASEISYHPYQPGQKPPDFAVPLEDGLQLNVLVIPCLAPKRFHMNVFREDPESNPGRFRIWNIDSPTVNVTGRGAWYGARLKFGDAGTVNEGDAISYGNQYITLRGLTVLSEKVESLPSPQPAPPPSPTTPLKTVAPKQKGLAMTVRYKSATLQEFAETHHPLLSQNGIFIKTSSPFPPGILLKFDIRIQGETIVLQGFGKVEWKREARQASENEPAGMQVKFIKISGESRKTLEKILKR